MKREGERENVTECSITMGALIEGAAVGKLV